MGFLNKKAALLILLLAIFAEYFHELFNGIIHSYYISPDTQQEMPIYWSGIIYHFFNEFLTIVLITSVCILLWTNKASKVIMSGVFVWFLIEWLEITLQMLKIVDIRTKTSGISWIQLSICLTISLLVLFGNKKKT